MQVRNVIWIGLLAALLLAGGAAQGAGTDVRDFGAVGDGETDDTAAIREAIVESDTGLIVFPRGDYRITETIEIELAETDRTSLNGMGGVGRVLMDGAGPAFRFIGTHTGTAGPGTFDEAVWQRERMPQIDGLSIRGTHPEADGVQFIRVMQPTVRGALIREVRHGIHLVQRNRNVLIDSSHIYNCTGVGIYMDHVNLHQINIIGNHISYCNGGGIKVEGSEIRNLQITGNDIEYNYDSDADESADVWIDAREDTVAEGTITGNTIQARPSPNGANVRFVGHQRAEGRHNRGMWTIAGNLIGNQEVNIDLDRVMGVTVTGNHIYTAQQESIRVHQSNHIIISANAMEQSHNYGRDGWRNGITVNDSDSTIIANNVLDAAGLGSEESGGAVQIIDSRETTLDSNQILEPVYRGIYISGCRNTIVQGNQVLDRTDEPTMLDAIRITGDSQATLVQGNIVGQGSENRIADDDGTAQIEANLDAAE